MAEFTSKERVLKTFSHETPDRVPIDYKYNPGINSRLIEHYGVAGTEELLQALDVDFRHVFPPYTGPKLYEDTPDRRIDDWGVHRRWVEHSAGGYWDYCDFPLRDADEATLESWIMPNPDDFDYQAVAERTRQFDKCAVIYGSGGNACIINKAGSLFSMDEAFVRLHQRDEAFLGFVDRRLNIEYEILARTLEAAHRYIDIIMMGEDLGTQIGPMISAELYSDEIKPRHRRFTDLAASCGKPVMMHCCGSSSWAFEDFIEIGISAVDTLQPEALNMSPEYLKRNFSGRLAFHGCISTTGVLSFGKPDDVDRECRDVLETMMPGTGYCFCPTHQIQDNTPTENVVAMYDAVQKYGWYSS